jgi:hypothetical protein
MSVEAVSYALTRVRLRVSNDRTNAYSPEGKAKLIFMAGCMRMYLLKNRVEEFDTYVDNALGSDPDAMDYILDELFGELGFGDNGTRDELSAELAA